MKKIISVIFLAITILFVNFTVAEEISKDDKIEKAKEIGKGAFNMLKDIVQSDRVNAIGSTAKDAVSGLYNGAKEGIVPESSFCKIAEKNYDKIISNKWFYEQLGSDIQKALLNNDEYVVERLPQLYFVIKKADIDVVDVDISKLRIDEFKPQLYEPLDEFKYKDFSKRWELFWSKDLTRLKASYRCFEDEWSSNKNQLLTAIKTAEEIGIHLGYEKEVKNFISMRNSFK